MSPISSLVTDPDSFFRERSDDPSLKGPAIVVTLSMLLGVVGAAISTRAMASILSEADLNPTVVLFTQIGGIVGAVVGPYIAWVLFAGFFHLVSVIFDGEGSFTTTLALVGWGFAPSILGRLLNAIVVFYRWEIRGVETPPLPQNLSTPENLQQFQNATAELSDGPLVALPAAFSIVFGLWSGVLYVYAMKHGRDLSLRNAILTVIVPVLVGILFSLRTVLNAL